jgi:ferritin-like metal-binding protein YciE
MAYYEELLSKFKESVEETEKMVEETEKMVEETVKKKMIENINDQISNLITEALKVNSETLKDVFSDTDTVVFSDV